jgi:hypothetical protein
MFVTSSVSDLLGSAIEYCTTDAKEGANFIRFRAP